MDWLREFIQGNKVFLSTRDKEYFLSHADRQTPFLTLVMCSDSRVHPIVIVPDPINKVFTIQNIGNQIQPSEGSVDYGVYHLKTPLLMIMGHSGCGAIKAAVNGFDHEPQPIQSALSLLRPRIKEVCELHFQDKIRLEFSCTIDNINYQVEWALNKYRSLVEKGDLVIIGSYYDFVNIQKKGAGRIYIINVNGDEIDNSDFTW